MPKHKKTKEQKIKADERRIIGGSTYVFSSGQLHTPTQIHQSIDILAVIQQDVKKTALISLFILAVQIIFFFLLKNHVLAINFVRY